MDQVAAIALACLLLYLGLGRECAPRLLVPLAVGLFAASFSGLSGRGCLVAGAFPACGEPLLLVDFFSAGVRKGWYGPLLMIGLGAATDFGPILARPRLLAAAFGSQVAFVAAAAVALGLGVEPLAALAAGAAGTAEASTALYVGAAFSAAWAAPAALAAYLAAALAPLVQPALLRWSTTRADRQIRTAPGRTPTRRERLLFPLGVLALTGLAAPAMAPLLGAFCLGNLLREAGVSDGLTHALRSTLLDVVTVLLGVGIGAGAAAGGLWNGGTVAVVVAGGVGLSVATVAGVLALRVVNRFVGERVNPLVGGAAVSPLADSARIVQLVGSRDEATVYLLAEARGVAGAGLVAVGLVAGSLGSLFVG